MTGRRPLLLIAATADAERLRGGLVLACAEAALGGAVRLFLQLDATSLLAPSTRTGTEPPRDAAHAAHGLPTLAALIDDALELGVAVTACQSGLDLAQLPADALDPRIAIAGPVAILAAATADERWMML